MIETVSDDVDVVENLILFISESTLRVLSLNVYFECSDLKFQNAFPWQ